MDSKRNYHGNKELRFPNDFKESDDDSGVDILCPCWLPNREENIIGCDSLHCNVRWYHFACAGIDIKNVPEGEWLCISCWKSWRHNTVVLWVWTRCFFVSFMWGIILILVGIRLKNISPLCKALSLFGFAFALWLMPHVSPEWGGGGWFTVAAASQREKRKKISEVIGGLHELTQSWIRTAPFRRFSDVGPEN